MILFKLMNHCRKYRDDALFYQLQAREAIRWMEQQGVKLGKEARVLDLGCGHGIFGAELVKKDCQVTFADESNGLIPELSNAPFRQVNIDQDDLSAIGTYDL